LAANHGLPFVYAEGRLGQRISEAAAREARYTFLRKVRAAAGADAIITAHHEDDLLETAILNLLRGTGRKGLSSLQNTADIRRPLLDTSKRTIHIYAKANGLKWHEDSTNADTSYLRNYIRHRLLPRFDEPFRTKLRHIISNAAGHNAEIDRLLTNQLHMQPAGNELDRHWLIMLPHAVAREVLAAWLRARGIRDFDKKALERIVVAAKTFAPGKQIDVNARHVINVEKTRLVITLRSQNPRDYV
jgi:tRNA(Ile)-lysidine synthase TilS/MesJ